MGFPGGSAVKNPSGNAGDVGSIPGWEDPLEKEMATHSSILARKIPWTERTWQTTVRGVTKETDDLAAKTTTKPKIVIENFLLYLVMMYHLFSLLLDSIL